MEGSGIDTNGINLRKWDGVEAAKDFHLTNKKEDDADRAVGEETYEKTCKQLGETKVRNRRI